MRRSFLWLWLGCLGALLGGAGVGAARAGSGPRENCEARELEYALSARLRLSDTPFGAGDGVFDIGPGRLVLRLTPSPRSPGAFVAELTGYEMRTYFTVRSRVLFWKARVLTQAVSRVASGVAGRGMLSARSLQWSTPIQGYRTDGTLICNGSGCGMKGVPPEGQSPLHLGPEPVKFAPFVFAGDDLDTFQMPTSRLTHTEQPRQTNHLTFAGRKVGERCLGGSSPAQRTLATAP